jgi:hypothetical protein
MTIPKASVAIDAFSPPKLHRDGTLVFASPASRDEAVRRLTNHQACPIELDINVNTEAVPPYVPVEIADHRRMFAAVIRNGDRWLLQAEDEASMADFSADEAPVTTVSEMEGTAQVAFTEEDDTGVQGMSQLNAPIAGRGPAAGLEQDPRAPEAWLRVVDECRLEGDDLAWLGHYLTDIRYGFLRTGPLDSVSRGQLMILQLGTTEGILDVKVVEASPVGVRFSVRDPGPVLAYLTEIAPRILASVASLTRRSAKPISSSSTPMESPPDVVAPSSAIPPPTSNNQGQETMEKPSQDPTGSKGVGEVLAVPAHFEVTESPSLHQGVVTFANTPSLEKELKENITNGGLFVVSDPLPIRSTHILRFRVGTVDLSETLQVDVVFASAGRVGFSLQNPSVAKALFTRALQEGSTSSASMVPSESTGAAFVAGNLIPFGSVRRLLHFQKRRLSNLDASNNSEASALPLFELLIREGRRSVLTFASGDKRGEIFLHDGNVAFVDSHPAEDASSLGRILINQKKINETALRTALEQGKRHGESLGVTLVKAGSITPSILTAALREQYRIKLSEMLSWPSGKFSIEAWRDPPGRASLVLSKGLGLFWAYVHQRFDELSVVDLETLLGEDMARGIRRSRSFEGFAKDVSLGKRELRFLSHHLVEGTSLANVAVASPLGRLGSLRLIAVGLTAGLIEFVDGAEASTKEETTGLNRPQDVVRERLRERLKSASQQNHFEVLGVHWTVHPSQIPEAFRSRTLDLRPDSPTLQGLPEDVKMLATQLRNRIEDARKTLLSPQERIQYRRSLLDPDELRYAAEHLEKQGQTSLLRADRRAGVEALEMAVELFPTKRNQAALAAAREGRSLSDI